MCEEPQIQKSYDEGERDLANIHNGNEMNAELSEPLALAYGNRPY